MALHKMESNVFATSICNINQSRWTSKVVQIPCTITLTLAPICRTKLMRQQMKREYILELKTQGSSSQLVEGLAQKFGQSQKLNGTKDMNNGP